MLQVINPTVQEHRQRAFRVCSFRNLASRRLYALPMEQAPLPQFTFERIQQSWHEQAPSKSTHEDWQDNKAKDYPIANLKRFERQSASAVKAFAQWVVAATGVLALSLSVVCSASSEIHGLARGTASVFALDELVRPAGLPKDCQAQVVELQSVHGWQRATINSSLKGRMLATVLTSEAASSAHGAEMGAMMRAFGGAGVDFAVVVATDKDVEPFAEAEVAECEHAQLVHRLMLDGHLMLPALAVTGGRRCRRHIRAVGMAEFRQVLADVAYRNAYGVKTATVPVLV